jgi:uncharacterized membrane protein (UPF0127 family)
MRSMRWVSVLILAAWLPVGCGKPPAAPAPRPVESDAPTAAQPKLPTMKLYIGPLTMETELALSPRQQETGMMFRKETSDGEGMIFVFPQPQQASFWMKNTHVPLSIAYIGPNGAILEIHDLQPLNENAVRANSGQVLFALETPQGWFKRNNIGPGTVITTDRGTLRQTFFRQR